MDDMKETLFLRLLRSQCFSSIHYQNCYYTIKKGRAEILQNARHDSLNVQACSTSAGTIKCWLKAY